MELEGIITGDGILPAECSNLRISYDYFQTAIISLNGVKEIAVVM
jgi:hypothetical protein